MPRDQQGDRALARIQDQGGDSQILAPGAQDVGRADVARTDLAHVARARRAGQDDAEGNGAQQVSANSHKPERKERRPRQILQVIRSP